MPLRLQRKNLPHGLKYNLTLIGFQDNLYIATSTAVSLLRFLKYLFFCSVSLSRNGKIRTFLRIPSFCSDNQSSHFCWSSPKSCPVMFLSASTTCFVMASSSLVFIRFATELRYPPLLSDLIQTLSWQFDWRFDMDAYRWLRYRIYGRRVLVSNNAAMELYQSLVLPEYTLGTKLH